MDTTDTGIITATAASRSFSELLHRVCYGGESFVIKKGNRLMARIVPVTEVMIENPVEEEIEPAVALPASITELLDDIAEPAPASVNGDEAEFYRAWMEQVRKVPAQID